MPFAGLGRPTCKDHNDIFNFLRMIILGYYGTVYTYIMVYDMFNIRMRLRLLWYSM